MIDEAMKEVADQGYVDAVEEKVKKSIQLEPKYVISLINGQPGLVIRFDHAVEGEAAIRAILPTFQKFREAVKEGTQNVVGNVTTTPTASVAPESGLTAKCATHGVQMTRGWSKTKNKEYWSHDNEAGERCFGNGFIPKR